MSEYQKRHTVGKVFARGILPLGILEGARDGLDEAHERLSDYFEEAKADPDALRWTAWAVFAYRQVAWLTCEPGSERRAEWLELDERVWRELGKPKPVRR